jgi:hypothetical protein
MFIALPTMAAATTLLIATFQILMADTPANRPDGR